VVSHVKQSRLFVFRLSGLIERPEARIRHVNILYHLEDDTVSIWEPRVEVKPIFMTSLGFPGSFWSYNGLEQACQTGGPLRSIKTLNDLKIQ